MAEEDSVVLSFGDSFLRKSDIDLLTPPNRINDRLIGFCFEYFEREQFNHSADKIALLSPSLVQFVIFASVEDLVVLLEPFHLPTKQYIFVPVSSTCDAKHVGKTQWSLLVYVRSRQEFQHYDLYRGSNQSCAKKLVDKLQPYVQAPRSKLKFVDMDFPQQETILDSGLYVIALVEHLIKEFCECISVSVNEVVNHETVQHKQKEIQALIHELSALGINMDHYLCT